MHSYVLFALVCVGFSTAIWVNWFKITDFAISILTNDVKDNSLLQSHLQWFAPKQTTFNNLEDVLSGNATVGFVFDGSEPPTSSQPGTFNWCNMPRVNVNDYVKAPEDYNLEYVEVIHRHHKRTPYASNTFPVESYEWNCDDESLFYYGTPEPDGHVAAISWQVYTSPVNPLSIQGFDGTCQFPQITAGGLMDSRQHGSDLYGVYHDMLGFLDGTKSSFRVTNNQITSQVAGQVIYGMNPVSDHQRTKVLVQPYSVDSLEPGYACPRAETLKAKFGVGSKDGNWLKHLQDPRTRKLLAKLDSVSGIKSSDLDWHGWFDHYFDSLSARLCHGKPLPCNVNDPTLCITQEDANTVFRLGMYEYSYLYRDTKLLFEANIASYGIWLAELAANLRNAIHGENTITYRHNIAHDGSISRLLSILQVDVMFWPGMGSEVVFELYIKQEKWYLRVLWCGQVLTSSYPDLGTIDLLPVETFLGYIDGLVGVNASKITKMCGLNVT